MYKSQICFQFSNTSDVDVQKKVFRRQLKIAVDRQLPLVIHCRDANADTLQILKEVVFGFPETTVVILNVF